MNCDLCNKKHNYYLIVEKKKIPSAVCKKCELDINKEVLPVLNKVIKLKSK